MKTNRQKQLEGANEHDRKTIRLVPRSTTDPKMPSGLSEQAKKHWRKVVPELINGGIVGELDSIGLAIYCETWSDLQDLRSKYQTEQDEIKQARLFRMMTKCQGLFLSYSKQFGLDPLSRIRLGTTVEPKGDDDDARFFGA
jgi:P27 family predicted phage terminase small subunit